MKTIYLLMMILLATHVMAKPDGERRNPLNLTDEQKQQMQAVKQATHDRLQAARAEIMADSNAQMAKFLSAEQMQQLESMQQHRQQHRPWRNHHKRMKKHRFNGPRSEG